MINICILGDFSGHTDKSRVCSKPNIYKIDIDNINEVIQKINPKAEIILPHGQKIEISIEDMEDFHPDNLFEQLDFDKYTKEFKKNIETTKSKSALTDALVVENNRPEELNNILNTLLSKDIPEIEKSRSGLRSEAVISKLLEQAVKSNIEYEDIKGKEDLENKEKLYSIIMSDILKSQEFKGIESIWMSLNFLLSSIGLDEEDYSLYIADISKNQMSEDLFKTDNIFDSNTYKTLLDKFSSLTNDSWNLLLGSYTFGINHSDIDLLKKITQLSNNLNVPFIAGGELPVPLHFNIEPEFTKLLKSRTGVFCEWDKLSKLNGTENIALAFPRFILRYPYSPKDNPIDSFDFKEISSNPDHQDFLWGNSAFLCCAVLASEQVMCNMNKVLGKAIKIGDLPMVSVPVNDDKVMLPCAEVMISDRKADEIENIGLLPVISAKHDNSIYLKFNSLNS